MAGCGLQELLELIYAPKAVEQILAGKAVARAIRGHFIVDAVLNAMFLSNLLGAPIPHYLNNGAGIIDVHSLEDEQPDSALHSDQDDAEIDAVDPEGKDSNINPDDARYFFLQNAKAIYDELIEKTKSAEEVAGAEVLKTIKD